jgi:hypothetical protein
MKFTHRGLCEDLAMAKGTKFIEVNLGSPGDNAKMADVINLSGFYRNFLLDIYECKVSRSDFLHDLKSKKYENYLDHSHRLFFATLPGIIEPKELPSAVGLIVRDELKGWAIIKQAKKRHLTIPQDTLLSLIYKKLSQDNFERRNWILSYAKEDYWTTGRNQLKKILNPKVRKALAFYDKNIWREEQWAKGK